MTLSTYVNGAASTGWVIEFYLNLIEFNLLSNQAELSNPKTLSKDFI